MQQHRRQHGAATLVVVMILFFIMAMMAAYANRSLIFEQRIASNYYRSAVAVEAADAGLELTLAMLNSGPIGGDCKPNPAGVSFVQRYMTFDPASGQFVQQIPLGGWGAPAAACIRTKTQWQCNCAAAAPWTVTAPPPDATTAEMQPSLQVGLEVDSASGLATIKALGCTGSTPAACFAADAATVAAAAAQLLGAAQTELKAALVSALKAPPTAALTVKGDVADGGARLGLHNVEANGTGLLLQTGGSQTLADSRLDTLPGTPTATVVIAGDSELASGSMTPALMFARYFGMSQAKYQTQPAIRDAGCTDTCGDSNLSTVIANGASMIWVKGPLTLSGTDTFGSAANPVVIIVNGNVTISGSVKIYGLLYATGDINAAAPDIAVYGAVIGGGAFSIDSGKMDIYYKAPTITMISKGMGSFVRVPGSWQEGSR